MAVAPVEHPRRALRHKALQAFANKTVDAPSIGGIEHGKQKD